MTKREEQTFNRYVRILKRKYEEVLKNQYIQKPLSWALYYTWRDCNDKEKSRFQKEMGELLR